MTTSLQNDALVKALSAYFVRSHSTGYGLNSALSMGLMLPCLRAMWSFSSWDEYTDVYDLSGQGRVLTNNNAVVLTGTHGVVPYADFTRASSQSMSRDDEIGLSITDNLDLMLWCWFDAASTGNETGLISKWLDTGNKRSYALIKTAGNVFRFQVSDDGTNVFSVDSTVTYAASQWFFISGQYVPSTSLRIFVNGTWDSDVTGIPAALYNNDQPLYLGSHNGGSYLDGRITLAEICKLTDTNYATITESLYQGTRPLFGRKS